MLTAREIAKELGVDVADVRRVLPGVDQGAIVADEKARLIVEVWDGVSDIQGVPAAHWAASGNLPEGGKMYLIKHADTGLVMIAQPHAPMGIGRPPMTEADALRFGTQQRDQAAEAAARAAILRAVDLALDA